MNTSKKKIVIFSRGGVRRYPDFVFGTEKLDVVDEYVYLGVKFNYNGNYKKMIAKQITQARKALYCMLTKARKLQLYPFIYSVNCLTILCYLSYYIMVVKYGGYPGYEDFLQVEVFHHKFIRLIFHVNRCTPDSIA